MRLFSRDRPPAAAVAELAADERVLAWADTGSGAVLLATSLGLRWPGPEGSELLGWQYVSKATWQDGILSVVVADVVDGILHDRRPIAVALSVPRDLPFIVRKRVNANIVKSELASVDGGAVRFVGRRIPGAGGVEWWARMEPGTPLSAEVRSAVQARLAILRAEWEAARRDR
jgi:hypothetical protein